VTFTIPNLGVVRSKDYGNYIAGYAAGFLDDQLALALVRGAGIFYENFDSFTGERLRSQLPPNFLVYEDLPDYWNYYGDDPISVRFINDGWAGGEQERATKFRTP
jgi:hypothetical protein